MTDAYVTVEFEARTAHLLAAMGYMEFVGEQGWTMTRAGSVWLRETMRELAAGSFDRNLLRAPDVRV